MRLRVLPTVTPTNLPDWVEQALMRWPTLDTLLPLEHAELRVERFYTHCRSCRRPVHAEALHARAYQVHNWLYLDVAGHCPGCGALVVLESRQHPDGRLKVRQHGDRWRYTGVHTRLSVWRPSYWLLRTLFRRGELGTRRLRILNFFDLSLALLLAALIGAWLALSRR